ncbi:MAG TPA: hypothetical protein VHL53_06810 [Acidimicrobiia bacterium]|nr:hypothetical protein [Acidimicrobiia bacterium]
MTPSHPPLRLRLRRRAVALVAAAVSVLAPLSPAGAPPARAADPSAGPGRATGYWMVASDGGIFAFGDAGFFGSTGAIALNQPIVGMAATPSGQGYWLVASDGGIFAFGDAAFFGSTGAVRLNRPIVGMAPTPTGGGYWFVASDGGVFSFGDAAFFGSTGAVSLNRPIVGMAATPSGRGYWLVASDGGLFSYGDAPFLGAAPSVPASAPRTVAALVPTADGAGYWQATSGGEALAFGAAPDLGGLTRAPSRPIVGLAARPAAASGSVAGANPPDGTSTTTTTTATTGSGPTTPGATTTTTGPPTTTTTAPGGSVPPASGPARFSSTAKVSWGTPADPDRPFVNSSRETTYPYAQKVSDVVEIGDRVFIGGQFTDLVGTDRDRTPSGVPLAYLAELDRNGVPVPGSAFNATVQLDGPVRVLYPSPDGRRLYVGGDFKRVNGQRHDRLVALDPVTGAVDPDFNPPVPNAYVAAITGAGGRLYIAGGFATLGGVSQPQLAALDAATGALDRSFVPPPRSAGRFEGHTGKRNDAPTSGDPTGVIASLLLTPDGRYLMVGGSFLHFGTDHAADEKHRHSGLVALDPGTGALTPWQPDWASSGSRPVFGMTVWPGDPRTIGVDAPAIIYTAAGGAGGRVVAWTPGGKTTALWRGNVDGDALDVAATIDRVYLVGHYDHVVVDPDDPCLDVRDLGDGHFGVSCPGGTPHRHLAAFDARGEIVNGKHTGKAILDPTFTAQADTAEGPNVIVVGADQLYVGGNFAKVAEVPVASGGMRTKQPGFAIYPALP